MRRDVMRCTWRPWCAALGAIALLIIMLAASAQQAEPVPAAPASPPAEEASAPPAVARQPRDLHALFEEEYQRRVATGESTEGPLLRVGIESNGTVVVRNAEGKVLEVYPLEYFSFRNMVSGTTMAQHAATQEHVAENREAYEAERAKEAEERRKAAEEAAKRREEAEKAEAERQEEAWRASAKTYRDPTTGKDVQAVKINPREIRPDGTYERNGQAVKPLRIFNRRTGKYENVVPISTPAP